MTKRRIIGLSGFALAGVERGALAARPKKGVRRTVFGHLVPAAGSRRTHAISRRFGGRFLDGNRGPAPFRPFFLIAALDAVAGACAWLLVWFEVDRFPASGAATWHRNALLFGTIPAVLAGFLLTALPRWTGRPAVSSRALGLLVAFWIAGRGASLLSAASGLAFAAFFLLSVTAVAAGKVLAGGDRRNSKTVLLLAAFSLGAVLMAAGWHAEFALRACLAAVVALMSVIGGRVVPALTAAYIESRGAVSRVRRRKPVEILASTALAMSLGAWVAIPGSRSTGLLCLAAFCAQLGRLLQWQGIRTTGNWSILSLHLGYFWIAAGFALLAAHTLAPELLRETAAIHAWTIGAFGTLGVAIMASMVRKHMRRPFSRAAPATAACVSVTLSCVARLMAETPAADLAPWATLSASMWVAAFGLFLAAFGRHLVPGAARRAAALA